MYSQIKLTNLQACNTLMKVQIAQFHFLLFEKNVVTLCTGYKACKVF